MLRDVFSFGVRTTRLRSGEDADFSLWGKGGEKGSKNSFTGQPKDCFRHQLGREIWISRQSASVSPSDSSLGAVTLGAVAGGP